MLSATSGYILPIEMRAHYEVSSNDSYHYLGFAMVNRPQPNGNRDDDQYGYLQDMKLRFNDVGGSTVLNRYNNLRFDGASAGITYNSASALNLWSAYQELSAKTNGTLETTKQSGIDLHVDDAIFTSRYEGTGVAFSTSVDAILLERNPDNDNTDNIESTGNHKETPSSFEWTPFDENESASGYVFKQLVVKNPLVVNAATCESRTYPIIRAVGGVS